jgi:hypothetical protein
MTFATRRNLAGGSLLLALPAAALAAPTFDGLNIPADFADAPVVVTQRIQTQFGDNAGNRFTFGSELNQMFIMADDDFLYIGITGNVENNGNAGLIFIDTVEDDVPVDPNGPRLRTRSDPATPLAQFPRYLGGNPGLGADPGLDGLGFDAEFFPEHILGWTGGSPRGSRTRSYYLVNWTTVVHDNANAPGNTNGVAGMMTDGDPTAAGPPGTLGDFLSDSALGILGASSNINGEGVIGGTLAVDPNDPDQPDDATSGFEFGIPRSLLGGANEIRVFALVGGTTGFISNQMLPPPATETDFANIGFVTTPSPRFSFEEGVDPMDPNLPTGVTGDQWVTFTFAAPGDVDGDGDVDLDDLLLVRSGSGLAGRRRRRRRHRPGRPAAGARQLRLITTVES